MAGSYSSHILKMSKFLILYKQVGPPPHLTGTSLYCLYRSSQFRCLYGGTSDKSNTTSQNNNKSDKKSSQISASESHRQPLTDVNTPNKDILKIDLEDNRIPVKPSKVNRQFNEKKYSDMGLKASTQFDPSKYFKQTWKSQYNKIPDMRQRGEQRHSSMESKGAANNEFAKTPIYNDSEKDVFGTLRMTLERDGNKSKKFPDMRHPNERIDEMLPEDIDEPRDRRLDIPLTRDGRIGKNAYYYTRKMSIAARQGKIKEAIEIFDYWMMVRDRVMPNKRTFITLIGILGRVGYTEKAFELFGKMKSLGLDPVDHIYTSLFNACANCPFQADGLRRTQNLLHQMRVSGVLPNLYTVKAAMKSLALGGDFPQAFMVLDEASTRLKLDAECFNALLFACIADKKSGFRRALQVWQKMVENKVQPSINTFNLLIRSARDCGIGDPASFASAFNLNISPDGKFEEELGLLGPRHHPSDKDLSDRKLLLSGEPHKQDLKMFSNCDKTITKNEIHKGFSEFFQCVDQEQLIKITPLQSGHDNDKEGKMILIDREHLLMQDTYEEDDMASGYDFDHSHSVYDSDSSFDKDLAKMTDALSSEGEAKVYEWWEEELSDAQIDLRPFCGASEDPFMSNYSDIVTEYDFNSMEERKGEKSLFLKELKNPSNRLALLGGANKLIEHMKEMGAPPDIKTFTQILACLPDDEKSEYELLTLMEENSLKPDVDFLNDIMMRRNKRHMHETVKAILPIMSQLRLVPNMRTYAALALTCRKNEEAEDLLNDMKNANLEPDTVIMTHFIYSSLSNFSYKLQMLKTMEEMGLRPNEVTIAVIEKSIAIAKRKVVEAEKNKDTDSFYLSEAFQRSLKYFLRFYKPWLLRTELEKSKHPWEAFQTSATPKETDRRFSVN